MEDLEKPSREKSFPYVGEEDLETLWLVSTRVKVVEGEEEEEVKEIFSTSSSNPPNAGFEIAECGTLPRARARDGPLKSYNTALASDIKFKVTNSVRVTHY